MTRQGSDRIESLLRPLFRSPEGRAKIATSLRVPVLRRWHGPLSVPASLWPPLKEGSLELPSEPCCAYVISDREFQSVDLSFYPGATKKGKAFLPMHMRLAEALGEAQTQITQELIRWEHETFFELLRRVPGKPGAIEAPDLERACDKVQDEVEVRGFVVSEPDLLRMQHLKGYEQFRPSQGALWTYAGSYRDSSVFVSKQAEEMWAFVDGAGILASDIHFEVCRGRVNWKAVLKMGVTDPSKIFEIKVTP